MALQSEKSCLKNARASPGSTDLTGNTGRFLGRRDRPANALIRRERDGAL